DGPQVGDGCAIARGDRNGVTSRVGRNARCACGAGHGERAHGGDNVVIAAIRAWAASIEQVVVELMVTRLGGSLTESKSALRHTAQEDVVAVAHDRSFVCTLGACHVVCSAVAPYFPAGCRCPITMIDKVRCAVGGASICKACRGSFCIGNSHAVSVVPGEVVSELVCVLLEWPVVVASRGHTVQRPVGRCIGIRNRSESHAAEVPNRSAPGVSAAE